MYTNKNTFIFDMDGVIIDSEPFWRQAQIKILSKYNATITEKIVSNTLWVEELTI